MKSEFGEPAGNLGQRHRSGDLNGPRWKLSARSALIVAVVLLVLVGAGWAWREWQRGWGPGAGGGELVAESELLDRIGVSAEDLTGQSGPVEPEDQPEVVVYVSGAVQQPGVFALPVQGRVIDAVEAAGGALPTASLTQLNLARPLTDGEQIYVQTEAEARAGPAVPGTPGMGEGAGTEPACVDVNQADGPMLEQLPGIGPALAERILTYRNENGPFATPGDLRQVSGIGPKVYARLEPSLCG
ncbi:ComEA family DNA-binding protein [Actinomyces sp. F1_1611]